MKAAFYGLWIVSIPYLVLIVVGNYVVEPLLDLNEVFWEDHVGAGLLYYMLNPGFTLVITLAATAVFAFLKLIGENVQFKK